MFVIVGNRPVTLKTIASFNPYDPYDKSCVLVTNVLQAPSGLSRAIHAATTRNIDCQLISRSIAFFRTSVP